jgi:fructose-specific phosphotransferase system IIC component
MTPNPVSSNPILRTTLVWSGGVTAVLAVLAAIIGYSVDGTRGLWSALAGVLIAAAFLAITGASILIANRWYGDPLYVPIFFGVVLGGWIIKFVLFLVAMLVLRDQPWINPTVFVLSVIASVVASLIVDVVVMLRMRVPYVGDVTLPTDPEAGERTDPKSGPESEDPRAGTGAP